MSAKISRNETEPIAITPTGVEWIGMVEPLKAITGDLWDSPGGLLLLTEQGWEPYDTLPARERQREQE